LQNWGKKGPGQPHASNIIRGKKGGGKGEIGKKNNSLKKKTVLSMGLAGGKGECPRDEKAVSEKRGEKEQTRRKRERGKERMGGKCLKGKNQARSRNNADLGKKGESQEKKRNRKVIGKGSRGY